MCTCVCACDVIRAAWFENIPPAAVWRVDPTEARVEVQGAQ